MDVSKVLVLRGPNIWADVPVLEAWVDLGPLHDLTPDELPGNGRLRACLGDHPEEPPRGDSLAHHLGRLALTLQRLVGSRAHFSHAQQAAQSGAYKVAIEYEHEELGRAALAAARDQCLAAIQGRRFDADAELAKLRALALRLQPAPLPAAVMEAARRRDIPVRLLGEGLLLGQGAKQRRVFGARTDRTGALAESISRDAGLTRKLLRTAGVPVVEPGGPPGPLWRMFVVGGRVTAAQRIDSPVDVTGPVHPELAARAVEAAEVVGLDVAGVVVAARGLAQPLEGQGGVVAVEANPPVGAGAAENVGEALVASLFPQGENGRVPVVTVTGVNGKTTVTRLIAHILTRGGRRVGMTCTEGIYVGGRRIELGDCSGPRSAQTVLQHPEVEAAVLETARGGILRAGLGYGRCDVAVVTNIGEGDHLGLGDIETAEQLARVKRVLVEAVGPDGSAVLNANDPLVAAMGRHCRGSVIFFARSEGHPVIAAHRAAGGRAAFVREGRIVLAEGEREVAAASMLRVPMTAGGRIGFQVENVLAAVAAAWALGAEHRTVQAALRSFSSDVKHTPGRFNLLEVNGAIAVLDYGHNPSSLAAVIEALQQFPPAHRTAAYSTAGDRRDSDMVRQGELLGDAFDRVILFEDESCIRGRQPGEIIGLFRKGAEGRSRVGQIEEVRGAMRAADLALSSARPGELLLIQVDLVEETMDLVREYVAGGRAREVCPAEALALLSGTKEDKALGLIGATERPNGAGLRRRSARQGRELSPAKGDPG